MKMNDSKTTIAIVTIAFGAGALIVALLFMLGAKVTSFTVGPAVIGLPTDAVQSITQPTLPSIPATVVSAQPQSNVRLAEVQKTGAETRKTYNVNLSSGEVIVGDAYDFQDKGYTCVVFSIRGPGAYQFSVLDGAWYKYLGVSTNNQAEELLQARVQYLQGHWFCKNVSFPVERIGE